MLMSNMKVRLVIAELEIQNNDLYKMACKRNWSKYIKYVLINSIVLNVNVTNADVLSQWNALECSIIRTADKVA